VFDAGGFQYDVGSLASPLNVAAGIEARREGYSIFAGEPDSYRNGGVLLANGTPSAPGAQVFPGFRPANVVDKSRNAVGAYVDLEGRFALTENVRLAIGAENVTDEYPDPLPLALNGTGNAAFPNFSPFGRAGRFIYGRATVSF
jgi:iron complex outermembrane recepter protein